LEVTINTISDVQREAEIFLTAEELQPHFERAYKKVAPQIEVRGFRKGKVPLEMIKKLYGEAIEQDALDDIANDSFRSAMEEKHIEPLGQPAMVNMDFQRGQHFRFTIQYEVKPTFELKPYKGLAVEKPVHHVTDEEVQSEIERLRRAHATLLGVTLVRDNDNHIITADVQELADDGMPLIGKKTPDARFELADEALVQEIRDVLAQAEVGGQYRVRFSAQHGDHTHQHHIELKVKRIEKVELPEFNDEFVRNITGDSTATTATFLETLRKDLETYWARQSERMLEQAIINELVRMHEFTVPESLVNFYLDSFVEDIKSRSRDGRLPSGFDEKRFREENRPYAVFQAKWALIRERLIEAEGITATEEDVERLAASEAASLGLDKERLLRYYRTSNAATERVLSAKLMAFLKDHARVTEKVVDELT
jgi:trigger factor